MPPPRNFDEALMGVTDPRMFELYQVAHTPYSRPEQRVADIPYIQDLNWSRINPKSRIDMMNDTARLPETYEGFRTAAQILSSMAAARNEAYAVPGMQNWQTYLDPNTEGIFDRFVASNDIPFNVHDYFPDYDMRGQFASMLRGEGIRDIKTGRPVLETKYQTPYNLDFGPQSVYWNRAKAGRPRPREETSAK